MLDWALDDLVVSPHEWSELGALAGSLGMTDEDVHSAHKRYLHELVTASARDGKITDQEYVLIGRAVDALHLEPSLLQEMVRPFAQGAHLVRIQPGMRVCFTGAATYSDGTELPRARLVRIAQAMGLEVVESVTKKKCDLVVTPDTSSLSGKASKARDYLIPIVDVKDFACAEVGVGIPAS